MSFVTNFLTPLIQLGVYVFMFGGVVWFIYHFIHKNFPNLRWTLKYTIFRKKFSEEDVKWSMEAIERGMDYTSVKKFLLIKGTPMNKTNELLYIFGKVFNEMKGGITNGQSKQSNGTDEEKNPSFS